MQFQCNNVEAIASLLSLITNGFDCAFSLIILDVLDAFWFYCYSQRVQWLILTHIDTKAQIMMSCRVVDSKMDKQLVCGEATNDTSVASAHPAEVAGSNLMHPSRQQPSVQVEICAGEGDGEEITGQLQLRLLQQQLAKEDLDVMTQQKTQEKAERKVADNANKTEKEVRVDMKTMSSEAEEEKNDLMENFQNKAAFRVEKEVSESVQTENSKQQPEDEGKSHWQSENRQEKEHTARVMKNRAQVELMDVTDQKESDEYRKIHQRKAKDKHDDLSVELDQMEQSQKLTLNVEIMESKVQNNAHVCAEDQTRIQMDTTAEKEGEAAVKVAARDEELVAKKAAQAKEKQAESDIQGGDSTREQIKEQEAKMLRKETDEEDKAAPMDTSCANRSRIGFARIETSLAAHAPSQRRLRTYQVSVGCPRTVSVSAAHLPSHTEKNTQNRDTLEVEGWKESTELSFKDESQRDNDGKVITAQGDAEDKSNTLGATRITDGGGLSSGGSGSHFASIGGNVADVEGATAAGGYNRTDQSFFKATNAR